MLTKRCLLHTSHKRSRCWRRHPKLPTIETLLNITFGPPNHLPQNSPMKSHVLEAWIIVWNDKSSLFAIVKRDSFKNKLPWRAQHFGKYMVGSHICTCNFHTHYCIYISLAPGLNHGQSSRTLWVSLQAKLKCYKGKWIYVLVYNSNMLSHYDMVHSHLYNNPYLVDGVASPTYNRELIKC